MSLRLFCLVVSAVAFICVDASPSYRNAIPNGNIVSNPCGNSVTWNAVGHVSPTSGSGGLNAFGRDFQAAGHRWTASLCQKDSDGDGRTNGDELGDPNCVWTTGATPARTNNLGHPGICEPVTSSNCRSRNTFLTSNNCPPVGDKTTTTTTTTTSYEETTLVDAQDGGMTSDGPQWQLRRDCVCYCMDDITPQTTLATQLQNNRGQESAGRGRPRPSQDRGEQGRPGSQGQGRDQGQQQGRGGHQSDDDSNGHGNPPQKPSHDNRPSPPLDQTAEFSNTDQYDVKRVCTCACPKT